MEEPEVVEQSVEATPDVSESTPEEQEVDTPSQAQEPTEQPEEVEPPKEKQRSAQGRIKELVAEKKKYQSEAETLRQQLEQSATAPLPDEISPEEYRAMQFNSQNVAQEVAQLKFERMQEKLETDTERIYDKHPELKDNKALDDRLSKAWVENFARLDNQGNIVGYTKSPLQFVEEQMDIINTVKAETTVKNIRTLEQQRADSPVTPEVSASKAPKDPKDMSIQELEAKLGTVRR